MKDVAEAFADPAVDAVYGDLAYVSRGEKERVIRYWRAGEFSPNRLTYGWMPPHPTLFLRSHLVERWGGYDSKYQISADYDMILRYFRQDGFRTVYLPRVLVKMCVGGVSNQSLLKICQKSFEDYKVLKNNNIGGFGTLILKNLRKIQQFRFT